MLELYQVEVPGEGYFVSLSPQRLFRLQSDVSPLSCMSKGLIKTYTPTFECV